MPGPRGEAQRTAHRAVRADGRLPDGEGEWTRGVFAQHGAEGVRCGVVGRSMTAAPCLDGLLTKVDGLG
jgi:hypothetical protein